MSTTTFSLTALRTGARRTAYRAAHFDPGLRELRAAGTAMAAVLAAYGATLLVEHAAHLHIDLVIFSVVLSATLTRTQRGADLTDRLIGVAVIAASAAAASETSSLLVRHSAIADVVYAVAVAATIWVRRFGRRASKAGTVFVVPFVALLVTHAQGVPPFGIDHDGWSAVVAVIVVAVVAVFQWTAAWTGFSPNDRRRPRVEPAEASAETPAEAQTEAEAQPQPADQPAAKTGRRIPASTRMAAQMGTALGLAFAVGHIWFTEHWPWVVLTAFIVCSGARGRGDVLHKGTLRAAGAAVGTIIATWIAGAFPANDVASVVIIFAVLGFAMWLRQFSYVYWAACVTAVLSLLYGYFGESATSLLHTRLEEIAIGAVLGILAAWFVLPVRSGDVLKRRLADLLSVLGGILAAGAGPVDDLPARKVRFAEGVYQIELISRSLMAGRFLARLRPGADRAAPYRADAIDAVRRLVRPVADFTTVLEQDPAALTEERLGRLRSAVARNVGALRRAIGRREGTAYQAVPPARAASGATAGSGSQQAAANPNRRRAADALRAIDAALGMLDRVYPPAPAAPTAVAAPADDEAAAAGVPAMTPVPEPAPESSH